MTSDSPASGPAYLRTLPAVRARCAEVYALGQAGELTYFDLHEDKLPAVVDYCARIIERDYGTDYASIPPHSRWRHFTLPSLKPTESLLDPLLASFAAADISPLETAKRLIDLFVVSVLLDAGAGDRWAFTSKSGERVTRSEGLAVGSLEFYEQGGFSGVAGKPLEVNLAGLRKLTVDRVGKALQVSEANPMAGLEGRAQLLLNLGDALAQAPKIFGEGETARPGNMLDFLARKPGFEGAIHISDLWPIVMDGLGPVWPATRTKLEGVSLGDAWVCESLAKSQGNHWTDESAIVPFHKLSQWLTYSLLEPIDTFLHWTIAGRTDQTGLPEYRNGGLLLDLGFLSLKIEAFSGEDWETSSRPGVIPRVEPGHQAVIEWRAVTVIALDKIAAAIREHLSAPELTTAQVLEAATWKGGREIAKTLRADTGGGPPLEIISDGTVF